MMFFLVAFAVLLHVLFWGTGLAVLAMPRPWRTFWPVLALPAGFTLQSLVVWFGAYLDLRGTNSYGWPSELLPAALLVIALFKRGASDMISDASRFRALAAVLAGCLILVVAPMSIAAHRLTTMSLGSCDAADYAAGARVFMEFARSDRLGFLGLTEVVKVASVDNFFDFWLRLNHFTPSALIALNGTILHCAPYQLISVFTAVLLAASIPTAFWMARAVLRYRSGVSVAIAALYGLSPIGWYAVAHVTMGQWLAAQAIVLLTWGGVALWRGPLDTQRAVMFGSVLAIGYALVLGSYNFILLVCLVPAVAYAGGLAWWTGRWKRFARWMVAMLAPLALAGGIFFERVAGLVERFQLFKLTDFGWQIPALTPEGWLGMVSGPRLEAWRVLGLRWILAAGIMAILAWSFVRAVRLRQRAAWSAACVSAPILAGYVFLQLRAALHGTNQSYDAYKIFAVFYPGLLAASCWWLTLRTGCSALTKRFVVPAVAAIVLALNLLGDGMFFSAMSRAPLTVDDELKELRKIEAMPDVASLNMLLSDTWSRLWANQFLLRKPQYFHNRSYEGRRITPLHGQWDLESCIISVKPPGPARRQVTAHYALVDTRDPQYLRATFGDGWYDEELEPASGKHWRWTKGDATIQVENPHEYPLAVVCTIDGLSKGGERALALVADAGHTTEPMNLGTQQMRIELAPITAPPGNSTLTLHSPQPPTSAGPGDSRMLGVCVFGFDLAVQPR